MSEYEECLPVATTASAECLLSRAFVNEYLKDFSPVQACYRIGVEKKDIARVSKKLMKDPRVISLLRAEMRAMDEHDIVTRSEILNSIKYIAITSTNEDTRFKAWSKLAKLAGMEVLYIKTDTADPIALAKLSDDMSIEDMATVYADEVLNG